MNQTSNLASTFDPNKLVEVTPNQRRSEPYHMRYSQATKRFRFSVDIFTALDLNSNGVSIFRYPTGEMILSVQGEENSQVLKTRSNAKVKGKEFTSRTLANGLSVNEDGRTDLVLTPLPSADGDAARYFQVSELNEGDELPSLGRSTDGKAESDDSKDDEPELVVGKVVEETDAEAEAAESEDQGDSEDELADDDFEDDEDADSDEDDDDLVDFG